jgi:hypothetical protein
MKRCATCKQEKPFEAFAIDRRNKDDCSCYCRECISAKNKTPEVKNAPSKRKNWGNAMFDLLDIDESEY